MQEWGALIEVPNAWVVTFIVASFVMGVVIAVSIVLSWRGGGD